jgi:hypothetical protein
MSKATILKDAERSLAMRVRRIFTVTPKGGPKGTSVELEGAQKDVQRAQDRLARAQDAHNETMAEAIEYADIIVRMGGTVDFDELLKDAPKVPVTDAGADGDAPEDTNPDADQIDSAGNPTDPEREPEPNNGDDEDDAPAENGASAKPVRIGGRFAKRGSQV